MTTSPTSPTASAAREHSQNAGNPIIRMGIIRMITVGEWFAVSVLELGLLSQSCDSGKETSK